MRAAGKNPVHDRDNDDYVYLVSNLADPAGRRYAKKRRETDRRIADAYGDHADEMIDEVAEFMDLQEWPAS